MGPSGPPGPPGPPGELPLLPPELLFQRDSPSGRKKRDSEATEDLPNDRYPRAVGYMFCYILTITKRLQN